MNIAVTIEPILDLRYDWEVKAQCQETGLEASTYVSGGREIADAAGRRLYAEVASVADELRGE